MEYITFMVYHLSFLGDPNTLTADQIRVRQVHAKDVGIKNIAVQINCITA